MTSSWLPTLTDRIARPLTCAAVVQLAMALGTAPVLLTVLLFPAALPDVGAFAALAAEVALLLVPALVAGCRTISRYRDGEDQLWRRYWAFFRRNYLSSLRLGLVEGGIILAAGLAISAWPAAVIVLIAPAAVWCAVSGFMIGFEAHLKLPLGVIVLRGALLAVRAPGLAAQSAVILASLAVIVYLAPGALLVGGLVLIAFVTNEAFHRGIARVRPASEVGVPAVIGSGAP